MRITGALALAVLLSTTCGAQAAAYLGVAPTQGSMSVSTIWANQSTAWDASSTVDFLISQHLSASDINVAASAVSATNGGSVQAYALMSGSPSYAYAYSWLSYELMIQGPDGIVPVTMSGSVNVSHSDLATAAYGYATASMQFNGASYSIEEIACFTSCSQASHSFSQTLQLDANSVYTVLLSARAFGTNGYDEIMAYADPNFTIAPDFAATYSLVESPGIENVSAAPEPAIWTVLLVGFAMIGVALRSGKDHGLANPAHS